jgi:hypothetical protein
VTKIQMPPGCESLKFRSAPGVPGKEYYGKPGGSVTVSPEHAAQIGKSRNGKLGLVNAQQALSIGTKTGKRCQSCGFLGQGWATSCARCDSDQLTEE